MGDLAVIRTVIEAGVLFTAVLLVILEIVSASSTKENGTGPQEVAKEFIRDLGEHKFSDAIHLLSKDLQSRISEPLLAEQVQAIEDLHEGICDVEWVESKKEGDNIKTFIRVEMVNDEKTLEIPLVKEGDLWRVASLAPVHRLAVIGAHRQPVK